MKTALAFVLLLLATLAHAEPVTIVKVIDGDTVWVDRGSVAIKVRLRYIDAPESCQAYGKESTELLTRIALGKVADLVISGLSYDRYVGTLAVDGTDLSGAMVSMGGAWVYRKATPKRSLLIEQENAARRSKTGLWATALPVEPWLFRKITKCNHRAAL